MNETYQAVYDAVRSRIGSADAHSAISDAVRSAFDLSYALPAIVQDFCCAAQAMQRPSVLYRPTLFREGATWHAVYDPNVVDSVRGYGYSPEKAMDDFDANWKKATQ